MSKIYGRRNNAWVAASNKGSVRYAGSWNDFGTVVVPAYESVSFTNPVPNTTDNVDGNDVYTLGIKFRVTVSKPCYGVRWRVPDTAPLPNGNPHVASLWDRETEQLLLSKSFTPTPGQYQDILFDSTINLDPSPAEYVVGVYMWHYVHRAPEPSSGWTLVSPSGNIQAYEGRLASGNGYPSVVLNAWYYVTPLVGT